MLWTVWHYDRLDQLVEPLDISPLTSFLVDRMVDSADLVAYPMSPTGHAQLGSRDKSQSHHACALRTECQTNRHLLST